MDQPYKFQHYDPTAGLKESPLAGPKAEPLAVTPIFGDGGNPKYNRTIFHFMIYGTIYLCLIKTFDFVISNNIRTFLKSAMRMMYHF